MTSDEVLSMPKLPGSAVVIGGGAIGCEFASMMGDLGTKVTILEALPQILNGCDADAAKVVERSFKKRGITTRTGVMVNGHTPKPDGSGTTVHFGDGESVEVDAVVVSVGRRPFADLLGLEGTAVGVDERGFVQVDERCRTAEPGVWAVGDLVNTPQLAHVAFAEGMLAIRDILGEEPARSTTTAHRGASTATPKCVRGHTEASAKEAGFDVVSSKHHFVGNGRAKIVGDTDGIVKVIAEKRPDGTGGRILGVHMVGPGSPSSLVRAIWPSTGKPPSTMSRPSSSPIRP